MMNKIFNNILYLKTSNLTINDKIWANYLPIYNYSPIFEFITINIYDYCYNGDFSRERQFNPRPNNDLFTVNFKKDNLNIKFEIY